MPMKSGKALNSTACYRTAEERGGVTPFNLFPISGAGGGPTDSHAASTPKHLADNWVRYISPPGGVVCDPFMGVATVGRAALNRGRSFVGIESFPKYFPIAERLLAEAQAALPLFAARA
jgi:hypothetical protein